ncbi:MAG TPA: nitrous oxide-stimulated promoter family protein [Phycisphaerae bacterium]|nr:nitrous oxide-stimulated promoter family protein [Phycisphaerae bacterium]HRR85324.1 nitrous oxide-stimulated promoter family protein [Phycisphaerae bacterium]
MHVIDIAGHNVDRHLVRDLRTLVRFIEIYCAYWHKADPRATVSLKEIDVKALMGRPVTLCQGCERLLAHAVHKRSRCPINPKPACKHCPRHCYHPLFRQQIREVMKFSGRKLVLSGRLDYLWHLMR